MLPGTKYGVEEVVRVVLRRKWLIATAVALGIGGGAIVEHYIPKKFRSETLIMIVPQRIPDSYVRATVTAKIEDRLPTISQQILSRSRLERIITDLDLYRAQRTAGIMEDVVERMRADIGVAVEKGDTFRVTYVSADPRTAQKVTERVASLFIEENLRDRENLAEDTNQFLESQLQDAKRRLLEHEKKLEAYNKRYSGQLPSQLASNMQQIQSAQMREQTLAEAMDRDRERKLMLERQLADQESTDALLSAPATPVTATGPVAADLPGASTAEQLEAARARLRLLETHAKPQHPDIRMLKRVIRDLEAKRAAESSAAPAEQKPAITPAEVLRQKRIRELKAEIDSVDREIKDKVEQDRRLRALIAEYQAKVDAVPTREAELVELTRDYTTLQTSYQGLLAKREDSKIAANLERRNIGEQFKILDPARVPERPITPDRRLLFAGGAAIGLVLAGLLVGSLEYLDTSLKREDDVVRVLSIPVLALVPVIQTDADRIRLTRRRVAAGVAMALGLVAAAVAAFLEMQP